MPFGGGSYADGFTTSVKSSVKRDCLQCLSAVGPMRTKRTMAKCSLVMVTVSSAFRRWVLCGHDGKDKAMIPHVEVSPVPFGGGSYADWPTVATSPSCPVSTSPVPFGGGSYADTEREMRKALRQTDGSPVPFGGGSYADLASPSMDSGRTLQRLQCLSAVGPMRTPKLTSAPGSHRVRVSSAFRRWVLCGRRIVLALDGRGCKWCVGQEVRNERGSPPACPG